MSPRTAEQRAALLTAARQQPGGVERASGVIKFQCPACAAEGHDAHQDNAGFFLDTGQWGCAFAKDTPAGRAHWDAIGRALGAFQDGHSPPGEATVAVSVCLASVSPQRIEWVWPSRLARGKLTVISGDPGLGKSLLILDLAAHISRGQGWPDRGAAPGGSFLLLSAEDGVADTIAPRFLAMGGDPTKVHVLQAVRTGDRERPFDLTTDLAALEALVIRLGDVVLIGVDPVSAYLGRTDSHRDASMRGVLMPLAAMAERLGPALCAVAHLNKATKETARKALYRTTGSIALPAAARMAFIVGEHPEDPSRRVVVHQKNNLAPVPPTLAFRIVASPDQVARVEWDEHPVAGLTADGVLGATTPTDEDPDAVGFLLELLQHGPVPAEQGLREAAKLKLSEPAVRRARRRLGVEAKKLTWDGPWVWVPKTSDDSPKTSETPCPPEPTSSTSSTSCKASDPPKTSPIDVFVTSSKEPTTYNTLSSQDVTCGESPPARARGPIEVPPWGQSFLRQTMPTEGFP